MKDLWELRTFFTCIAILSAFIACSIEVIHIRRDVQAIKKALEAVNLPVLPREGK